MSNVTYRPAVEVRFLEATASGTNYVGLKGQAAVATNVVWALPAADGTATYALTTDGAGALVWAKNGNGILTGGNTWTGNQTVNGGIYTSHATAGIGYTTGAGGTVTQLTSKATGVTINKATGQITTHNASLNDATTVSFVVTNSAIASTNLIVVNHISGGTAGAYVVTANNVGSGTFGISIRNVSGGALGEALVLSYAVLTGATS